MPLAYLGYDEEAVAALEIKEGILLSSLNARLGAGLGLATVCALTFAGAAHAGPRSHIEPYIVEQFLAVEDGDTDTVTVACNAGDTLVGANHKVDNTDGGVFTDATGSWSVSTSSADFTGSYDDTNYAKAEEMDSDRAQFKAYVTCLPATDSAGQAASYNPFASGDKFTLASFTVGSKTYRRTLAQVLAETDTASTTVKAGKTADLFVRCPKDKTKFGYFAMLGGAAPTGTGITVVGAEPRGDGFAFRIYNGSGSDQTGGVSSTLSCLRKQSNKAKRV